MTLHEDDGFKYLLGRYPEEALELFCPEVIVHRGPPQAALLLATEVPVLAHDGHHRLMDLAVRFCWADGPPLIITLLEHWSDRHAIDLRRVLRYAAELIITHPDATVLPIILMTDAKPPTKPLELCHGTPGWMAIRLEPRCIHLRRPDAIPAGHLGNHVAVLLTALVPTSNRIELVGLVVTRYLKLKYALEDLRVLLPFILRLASIKTDAEVADTYTHLRKEHAMISIIDLMKAEGKAEGKAEATLSILRHQIATGRITIDGARAEIEALRVARELTDALAAQVLAALG